MTVNNQSKIAKLIRSEYEAQLIANKNEIVELKAEIIKLEKYKREVERLELLLMQDGGQRYRPEY